MLIDQRRVMLLAQLNVAIPTGPLDGPRMADFVVGLESVNTADAAPGFVWRLQDEAGDATAIRPYDDDRLMVNTSAWRSMESLAAWVYAGEHLAPLVAEIALNRHIWSPAVHATA